MSDEITVRSSLHIRKETSSGEVQLEYLPKPTTFTDDLTGVKGPTPGAFDASILGTDVDLTELTTPGYCRIRNLDDTNFVTVGIWDPEGSTFHPFLELGPMKHVDLQLSRYIQEEYGTGTGTTGAGTNRLRVKADTATCNVSVEAFEK